MKNKNWLLGSIVALVLLSSLSSCGKRRKCGDCPKFSETEQTITITHCV
ncbi:MAG: hypothetical protein IPN94_21450 [Sphingobacteriales bacterium]|nr:hypothetical protein [Sphingobacteriales bacterium]